jgi:hypothetical protein
LIPLSIVAFQIQGGQTDIGNNDLDMVLTSHPGDICHRRRRSEQEAEEERGGEQVDNKTRIGRRDSKVKNVDKANERRKPKC